ncbi:MAG: T9SS type A sorting domain-containing protein [Chitinophagales bacterium]|nr:T9SS type A sorting domain-containing protein [Chitinophagales bacterium]
MNKYSILSICFLLQLTTLFAQPKLAITNTGKPTTQWWTWQAESNVQQTGERQITPLRYKVADVQLLKLKTTLKAAPLENKNGLTVTNLFLTFPMPDGSTQKFKVYESPIMEKGLAMKYPEIKTYAGYGVDDKSTTLRFDITPHGFHAMIISVHGMCFIDPYCKGNTTSYIVYEKKDFITSKIMSCDAHGPNELQNFILDNQLFLNGQANKQHKIIIGDCQKRTYRIAIAATGEYTAFHGGTVALAQAAQVTTMNRVNGVYEREVAVRMNIIANNDLLIYTNATTDPYTNGTPGTMIGQNQTNITTVIGSTNYDIGHVFGTNSGGLAGLGVVCSNSNKARGVTGSSAPVGDPFDIDYVAHEIGHQFGANHTFNGTASSCNGNGSSSSAYEPGSGSTIMAYAGICGTQNVQNNSDDYFHVKSLIDIKTYITTGNGNNCPVKTSLSNNAPTITNNGGNFTIPISTPFSLTATATDADATNVLTYCWEQYDNQSSTQPPVATSTGGPNFRSFKPDTSPMRTFPRLQNIVTNTNSTWEVLPSVTRTMNFQVTVRDNAPLGSCLDRSAITVTTNSVSGPFVVTYPTATGITWQAGTTQTVTWNVAGTDAAPVSCSAVDIFLSVNGGYAYPITLATNVPNTGTFTVTVPNNPTTQARVMVKGRNNIFFDISNNNFTITAPQNDYTLTANSTTATACAAGSAVYTLNIGKVGNYTSPVTLSTSGLPAGATSSFATNPVTPAGTSALTISTTGAVAAGTYNFNVNATSASGNKTLALQLIVTNAPATVVLALPTNGFNGFPTGGVLSWSSTSGATQYIVQIATDTFFSSIIRNDTVATTTQTISPALLPQAKYYWRVYALNSCGTGTSSVVFSFNTGGNLCKTYASTDVPKTISANGAPLVTSTLNVTDSGIITDVNVSNLVGTHTYISDLRFELRSPSNAFSHLMRYVCTSQDNFNIKFDDEAANLYAAIPCPPTNTQYYKPFSPLSALDGGNVNGTWTMLVKDSFNTDGGSLTAWSIDVCYAVPCNMSVNANINNATCQGVCDGFVATTIQGGYSPFSYAWSNSATTSSISAVCSGNYMLTITDAAGCTATVSAVVQDASPQVQPAVLVSANTNNICAGTPITFTATATNGGTSPIYQWKKNGNNVGTNSTTYTDNTLSNGDSVWCVLTSNAVCVSTAVVTSNKIVVSVSSTVVPTISIATNTLSVCSGQSVSISSTALGGGVAPVYVWKVNGNIVAGNTPQITLSSLQDGDVVLATLTSSETCASPLTATSNTLTFVVSSLIQPNINILVDADTVCAGIAQNFSLTSTGGGTPTYDWKLNGNTVATNATTYTDILNDGDIVLCQMTSSLTCVSQSMVSSNSIIVKVIPVTTPTITVTSTNTNVCAGQSASFVATPGNAGNSPAFNWLVNGQPVGNFTFSYADVLNSGDVVTCELTSSLQCAVPATVVSTPLTINVQPTVLPTVNISTTSTTICDGANVVFNASGVNAGSNPVYTWKLNGIFAGSGTIFGSSQFNDGDVLICELSSSATCALPATVTSNVVNIAVHPLPATPAASANTPVCDNDVLQFNAAPISGATYAWNGPNGFSSTLQNPTIVSPTLNASGVYYVVASVNGCSSAPASVSVQVNVSPSKPVITVSGNVLNSNATQGNQWWLNNIPLSGANAQTYTAVQSGWYKVSVTNVAGCSAVSDSVYVLISSLSNGGSDNSWVVYPNPTTGELTIQTGNIVDYFHVCMFTSEGRKVKEWKELQGNATLQLAEMTNGVYFVQIQTGNYYRITRIVKQ